MPLLSLPQSNRRLTIYIDAYDKQNGFVLMQEQPDGAKSLSAIDRERISQQSRTKISHIGSVWQ